MKFYLVAMLFVILISKLSSCIHGGAIQGIDPDKRDGPLVDGCIRAVLGVAYLYVLKEGPSTGKSEPCM